MRPVHRCGADIYAPTQDSTAQQLGPISGGLRTPAKCTMRVPDRPEQNPHKRPADLAEKSTGATKTTFPDESRAGAPARLDRNSCNRSRPCPAWRAPAIIFSGTSIYAEHRTGKIDPIRCKL